MIGKVNDACLKYMTLTDIRYLSSKIQQFELKGNFKNGRFSFASMLTSLKICPKCLTQNLILCLSRLHRENPIRITMYIKPSSFQMTSNKDINNYFYLFIYFFFCKHKNALKYGLFDAVELLLIPDCNMSKGPWSHILATKAYISM